MASVSSSPLDRLSLKEIAELSVDRARKTQRAPQLGANSPEDFTKRSNVINYLKIHGAPEKVAIAFQTAAKELAENSLDVDDAIEKLGHKNKEAWGHIKNISSSMKELLKPVIRRLKTSDPIQEAERTDIYHKILELSKTITQFSLRDILMDINIGKLSSYVKLS